MDVKLGKIKEFRRRYSWTERQMGLFGWQRSKVYMLQLRFVCNLVPRIAELTHTTREAKY